MADRPLGTEPSFQREFQINIEPPREEASFREKIKAILRKKNK